MPYLQKATNNYAGFVPAVSPYGVAQTNSYLVSSSGAAIFAGDPVILTSMGTVRAFTSAGAGTPQIALTSASCVVGVAAGYIPAFTASTASQSVLVYDDPNQIFFCNNTTAGALASSDIVGRGITFLATGAVGSTGPNLTLGRSVVCIGTTANTGAHSTETNLLTSAVNGVLTSGIYLLRVVGLHPIEGAIAGRDGASTASGTSLKWLVQWNAHTYAAGYGTVGNLMTTQ